MSYFIIKNLNNTKCSAAPAQTLLQALQEARIDWMQACGGKGRCTTCKFKILQLEGHLSEPTAFEQKCRQNHRLADDERLACQSSLLEGHLELVVPKAYQLPHLTYSS